MFEKQEEFISNIHDIFGDLGKQWLSSLPSLVKKISTDWKFTVQEITPRLTYSFVAKGITCAGEKAVLKLSPVNPRCDSEIEWFRFNTIGTPRLFKSDPAQGALLMAQIVPGYSAKKLVQDGDDAAATRAIAEVIRTLQPTPHDSKIFKPVSELAVTLEGLKGKVDSKLIHKAQTLFKELTTKSEDRILHGDLHHDNILFAGDKWLAIDPHGYIGPAAFEVGAMIRNPYDYFPKGESLKKILEKRLQILNDELTFDPYEIQGWAFAYTLMAAGWSVSDHGEVPKIHIEIAEALNEISIK